MQNSGRKGVLQISSNRDDRIILFGFEILIPGYFWVGNLSSIFWLA